MRILFLFVSLLLLTSSCKEEVHYSADQLVGYWNVISAKRSGKTTNTMGGAWVKIKGTEMMDNFFTNEVKYPFTLEGSKLTHHASPDRFYKVISLSSDTMVLFTKHLDYDFEFTFNKIAE